MELTLLALSALLSLVHSFPRILGLNEGDACDALGGGEGTCTFLPNCSYPGDFRVDQPPICTFRGKVPVICCPKTELTEERSRPIGQKVREYCKSLEGNCAGRRQRYLEEKLNDITRHVIGGIEAEPRTHVHMALIGYVVDGLDFWGCAGSLINSRYILSAAHCATSKTMGDAKWARFGDLDISTDTDDENIQEREIVEIILHPDYEEPKVYNDIVLFKLDTEVVFTDWVAPVCLHTLWDIPSYVATVTGWGRMGFSGPPSDQLREAELDVYNNSECRMLFPQRNHKTPNGVVSGFMFCAGKSDGSRDSCPGDSGGPLVISSPEQCSLIQIGITSTGDQCGNPDSPGIYTRVSNYIAWIEDVAFSDEDIDNTTGARTDDGGGSTDGSTIVDYNTSSDRSTDGSTNGGRNNGDHVGGFEHSHHHHHHENNGHHHHHQHQDSPHNNQHRHFGSIFNKLFLPILLCCFH